MLASRAFVQTATVVAVVAVSWADTQGAIQPSGATPSNGICIGAKRPHRPTIAAASGWPRFFMRRAKRPCYGLRKRRSRVEAARARNASKQVFHLVGKDA